MLYTCSSQLAGGLLQPGDGPLEKGNQIRHLMALTYEEMDLYPEIRRVRRTAKGKRMPWFKLIGAIVFLVNAAYQYVTYRRTATRSSLIAAVFMLLAEFLFIMSVLSQIGLI